MRGFITEGRERLEKALSLEGDIAPAIRAEALNGAGVLAHAQGDYLIATQRCLQSLRLAKQSGDKAQIAAASISLGMIAVDQGRYNRGRKLLEASVKLCHRLEHGWLDAWATHNLGLAMLAQGFFAVAEKLFQESLTLCQNLADPDPWLMSRSLNILGRVAGDRGNYEQAVQICMRA